jgi:beta-N-acetylhexosaminidase
MPIPLFQKRSVRRIQPFLRIIAAIGLIIIFLMPSTIGFANPADQSIDPQAKAKAMLQTLTAEEKVGQLFLVTFKGRDVSETSQIFDLIQKEHIGGVILQSSNDNFTGPDKTISEAYRIVTSLQGIEDTAAQTTSVDQTTKQTYVPKYVPLMIGISQEGDQTPYDQIISGLTPMPNLMAIGATWKTDLAQQVGEVTGKELSALGFNLFLGPSLDVLDTIHTEGGEDLGTRTFGGDPFWVGEMGQAIIKGIHEGSNNQMTVIAKHFPGRGGSDRPPEEEVATVQKSLEQLKQIELAPFFAVTGNSPDPLSTTDGLLVSHIRYQGFQGNIRATTKPISFDQGALDQLMALPQFASWRQNNGLMVSDNLGSQAVRKSYDPLGQMFDGRQVARSALLAGNDLLYLDNFVSTGDPDQYTTIQKTVEFFAQKYHEDTAFAQRVDQSVIRILTMKYRLYPDFSLEKVIPAAAGLDAIGKSENVAFDVARAAVTLVSPDLVDLSTVLPRPPAMNEHMVFITDETNGRQCSTCTEQKILAVDSLQNAVLKLYGPQAGGQALNSRLSSYSLSDLQSLRSNPATVPNLETDLRQADWIVIALMNGQKDNPEAANLRTLLSDRPDLISNKRIILFAFNAPYYLDATDISKLTAYYAVYSKTPAFVDVAARVLFQELTPSGALPVSVSGIGYDLISATSPNPNQVIGLSLDMPVPAENGTVTPEPTVVPKFKVGDTLPLKTSVILDHNNNLVPDGTVARFQFVVGGGDTSTVQQVEVVTSRGIAKATYRIQTPGLLDVRVVSDPALTSEILRLDITGAEGAAITAIAPTVVPTSTEPATATPYQTPTPLPTPEPLSNHRPDFVDWLVLMLVIWGGAVGVYYMARRYYNVGWAVRFGLLAGLGGVLGYLYIVWKLPGAKELLDKISIGGELLIIILGMGLGGVCCWYWHRQFDRKTKPKTGSRPNAKV